MGVTAASMGVREMRWLSQEEAFTDKYGNNMVSSSSGLTVTGYFFNSVFFLGFFFIILTAVSFYRFGLMLYYKHNPKSLEISLYVCVGFWALLRALFFLLSPIFPESKVLFFIYTIPTNIELAVYSLLLLYCAQRVHFVKWRKIRWRVYWSFIIVNTILFLINCIATLVVIFNDYQSNMPSIVNSIMFLIIFSIIAVAFVTYSIVLIRQKERDPRFKHENQKALIALTITITLCMSIHCIWDAVKMILELHVHIPSSDIGSQVTIFFMFLVWELIPACVVIIFFGRIAIGDERIVQRPTDSQVSVTIASVNNIEGPAGSKANLLEPEEKAKLLPASRRSMDGSSPGSLSNSLRHNGTVIPSAVTRGTTQLVGNDGSTPNFQFVTQQLAAIAAVDDKRGNSDYQAPPRSCLEFSSTTDPEENEEV